MNKTIRAERLYTFRFQWEWKVSCSSKEYEHARATAQRSIKKDLYGDLYGMVVELEMAVEEQDSKKCFKILENIFREIA